jgi:predicted PolB exonuclease-like 3'-5' exonuclease
MSNDTLELFADIETRPCDNPKLIELITQGITPPGNMSKAETIAKWEREDKPLLVKAALAKTSLDGTYGRLCSISFAFDAERVDGFIDRDEKKVLTQFYKRVDDRSRDFISKHPKKPVVVTHGDFDLRFLWQRSVVNGIKPHPLLPWNKKAWDDFVRDTMYLWHPSQDRRISLHKLCLVLGVPSPKDKHGMTGADVAMLWSRRKYPEILAYGHDDVEALRSCYRKLKI